MFTGAISVVAEDFDDTTLTDTAMATFTDHAHQFAFECFKFVDADFDLFEV